MTPSRDDAAAAAAEAKAGDRPEERRREEEEGGDREAGREDPGRMFTRGEDRVVHEHRHDNIVGDDGPGGRETARSKRAVAVARPGFDAELNRARDSCDRGV